MSIIKNRYETNDETVFRPQLTSLVDVMTILLVFLIKSFSVDGNIVTPSADLLLPVSSSEKKPTLQNSIEITRNAIISEGHVIVGTDELKKSDSLLITPLYDWMKTVNSRKSRSDSASFLLIQCDRETEFSIVKKVMFSCSKAGFTDFSVLVLQEE